MTRPKVIGSQEPCPHCGAPAVATKSEDETLIWWRPRTDCCDTAKARRNGLARFMPRRDFRRRTPSPDELEARREALTSRKDRS